LVRSRRHLLTLQADGCPALLSVAPRLKRSVGQTSWNPRWPLTSTTN